VNVFVLYVIEYVLFSNWETFLLYYSRNQAGFIIHSKSYDTVTYLFVTHFCTHLDGIALTECIDRAYTHTHTHTFSKLLCTTQPRLRVLVSAYVEAIIRPIPYSEHVEELYNHP
jgi:hypothetical protein